MSSSDDESFSRYHRPYPLHDAAEEGDMETLLSILRPPHRKIDKPTMALPAAAAAVAATAAPAAAAAAGEGGDGGVKEGGGGAAAATARDREGGGQGRAEGQDGGGDGGGGGNNMSIDDDDDNDADSDGFRPLAVDIEERDQEGCTPLHVALAAKKLDAARLLLECGAGTTRRLEGSPPAHVALSVASVGRHRGFADAALKLLLEHQHDVSVKDDRGHTLLHLAASFGLEEAMATLLKAPGGKELMDAKERLNCRPLHLAALGGHVGTTRALIAAGCDTSTTNLHGNTALHLACTKARWAMARVLLDEGKADVQACNKNRQTPAASALKLGLKIPDTLPELQPGDGQATSTSNGTAPPSTKARDKNKSKPQWQFAPAGSGSARTAEGEAVAAVNITPEEGKGGEGAPKAKTVVLHHPLCLEHHSCPPIKRSGADPPPENVKRLEVIYNEDSGVLRADEFSALEWDSNPSRAQLTDVLRVHDFKYVQKLERLCAHIPNELGELSHLDGDTAVSHSSFEAAMRAAGSVCDAVDRVMTGRNRNAFCAVRPPGHHAGTRGLVTCGNDTQGSHGFCLLNNVAIGAAYARCIHRHTGVDRVAIVDFDVHHGNGTEEIVKALKPVILEAKIRTSFCEGVLQKEVYHPWLNPEDPDKCLFVSVHGYGKKERSYIDIPGGWFYPGSGKTTDCPIPDADAEASAAAAAGGGGGGSEAGPGEAEEGPGVTSAADRETLVLDVGMPLPELDDTPGASRHRWRDVYRNDILPKLVAFDPDIIMVSAGFDAHKKDVINFGYIGLLEEDYEWVTQQLVQVANRCCEGRLVSVLEGGYRIQGGIVSAFGRSVAGHVRALVDGCESRQEWSATDAMWESNFERRLLQERERKRKLRLEQQMQAMEDKRNQLRAELLLQQQQQQQQGEQTQAASEGETNGHATGPGTGAATEAVAAGTNGGEGEKRQGSAQDAGENGGGGGGGGGGEPALPTKRRRTNVDYVALQKKLQEEETSGKSNKAAAGEQATASATATAPTPPEDA